MPSREIFLRANHKKRGKKTYTSPPGREAFKRCIWDIVSEIPRGKVLTYGAIASMIPRPKGVRARFYDVAAPRWVGNAMAACPPGLPWHRVINAQGMVSKRTDSKDHLLQRELLEQEGVVFDARGRVDLEIFGWKKTGR